jgi:hypothetical protein
MKRQITLSLLLKLSMLLLLVSVPSQIQGQQQVRILADTGVVTLGPSQVLRVTVAAGDVNGDGAISVRFRRIGYTQGACNSDGVCKYALASQATSDVITLMPGEAASLDLVATTFGRGIVLSNSRDVRVTAQIIDSATGNIIAIWVPQGSPVIGSKE